MAANDLKQRLIEALQLVKAAMNSPNTFENSKETTFSALRRGCLDLRNNIDQLNDDDFSADLVQDAWLFLIELSKAKLRRKHALECINVMILSPKWGSVLRTSSKIQEKLPSLSKDMQIAMGHVAAVKSPSISPSSVPSRPPVAKAHAPTPVPLSVRQKSKTKRGTSCSGREIETSASTPPAEPPMAAPLAIPVVAPSLPVDLPVGTANPVNPFRLDFNPFKESRGTNVRSNPRARQAGGKTWWDPESRSSSTAALPAAWWDT